jgi:two-component system cell cycle sensor histidine kinase/response regulator CckA
VTDPQRRSAAEDEARADEAAGRELRVLHLEDDPADAELVRETLLGGGIRCEVRRSETREHFEEAVREGAFDLILSDFTLPSYDGPSALAFARRVRPDVPFIIVSGTIGEDAAVASLLAGATDYVLKHRLPRLCPAVKRALREAEERRARARAEEEGRRLEERLRQAQKLEVVGQLAGGIAHDFNNILVVINSYIDLALSSLSPEDPLRPDLEEVQKAGLRAAALTRQLLAFSRKQVLQPVVLDLNAVVGDLEKMLRRVISEHVEIRLLLAERVGAVRADPAQIEQVLMNLVLNARDAMSRGGTLVISTADVTLDEAAARARGELAPGRYATLSVSDTGCGMDATTLARAFEPFFTTKPPGKGTGLGLSTVYGIVKQSGGHVEIESEVGRGTTVRVLLPRVASAEEAAPASGPSGRALGGNETILVVEDSESVRVLAQRVLGRVGYHVVATATGAEALARCADLKGPIHLLLTDMVLPGMSGRELARQLLARLPSLKVLYMSGYLDQEMAAQGDEVWANFMQKPFTASELVVRVRAALDADRR